jgi:hypothetical protein
MAGVRATTPMFKPVPGGHVFRAPSQWVFWRRRYYLVNETQRAEFFRSSLGVASIVRAAISSWSPLSVSFFPRQ